MEHYLIITFYSISQALRFEKLLQGKQIPVKLVPVPRAVSSACGIAARLPEGLLDEIASLVETREAEIESVYLFSCRGKETDISPCPGPWQEN